MGKMKRKQRWEVLRMILLLGLGLAGCGTERPPVSTSVTTSASVTGETATMMPNATEVSPTRSASEPPPVTPTAAAPAATPTIASESATPTVDPSTSTLLPTDAPWIRVENDVFAPATNAEPLALQEREQPLSVGGVMAAHDGAVVAFTENMPGRVGLSIIDMRSGERSFIEGATWATFAPDGRSVAFLVSSGNQWQLRRRALPAGEEMTLAVGENFSSNVPMPLAWTERGILVQHIIMASDAPPQGLQLIDAATGTVQPVYDEDFLGAVLSPDGAKIALTVGTARIGEPPRMGLTILDIVSGETQSIVPEGPMSIMQVRWSPDAQRLVYTSAHDYAPFATDLNLVSIDGTDNQALAFDEIGADGALRDVIWRDDATLLALGGEAGGELRLYSLPAGNLLPEALVEQATLGPLQRSGVAAIIYVPR